MAEQKTSPKKTTVRLIAENKKARFDFAITETYEAGLELTGSEVKSLRAGDVNLKDSYIAMKNGQAYLQNAHISEYRASSYQNHLPERHRRLLLNATELYKLDKSLSEKGLSCVPLKIYFKGQWVKLEIGLAKGKKSADKRQSIKTRDADRELAQVKRKFR